MRAVRIGNQIMLYDSYRYKDFIKNISGREWIPEEKAWGIPLSLQNVEAISSIAVLDKELVKFIEQLQVADQVAECDPDMLAPIAPMPIKRKPFQHQIVGFNMALKTFGY